MTTLTVKIDESLKARAEAQAVEAGCANVDEYVTQLIRANAPEPMDRELEAEILRGLDSGPAVPLTPELLNQIKREARRA